MYSYKSTYKFILNKDTSPQDGGRTVALTPNFVVFEEEQLLMKQCHQYPLRCFNIILRLFVVTVHFGST